MINRTVLILGNGHLAHRTKLLVSQKGFTTIHIQSLSPNQVNSDSSTINEVKKVFENLNIESITMTYVLFEKDEDNLEIIIALTALYTKLRITSTLFNENINTHLQKANPELIVLNPARIAAPFFVKELDQKILRKTTITKPPPINKVKHSNNSFIKFLISFFACIIISSILYFHFNEQLSWLDSLYFVVVTISTVGYGDINLQNSNTLSKIIGIILIVSSSVFIWLILSLLIDNILKKRTQYSLGRKKYTYKNHIILCGLGNLGYFVADELQRLGEKIVIIESDTESPNIEHFRKLKVDVYNGNARYPNVLQDAGAENCRALISVINDDYLNIEIGLNARYFQPNLKLILRIFDESMAVVIKEKFDIHLTKSMSFITAEKLSSILEQ